MSTCIGEQIEVFGGIFRETWPSYLTPEQHLVVVRRVLADVGWMTGVPVRAMTGDFLEVSINSSHTSTRWVRCLVSKKSDRYGIVFIDQSTLETGFSPWDEPGGYNPPARVYQPRFGITLGFLQEKKPAIVIKLIERHFRPESQMPPPNTGVTLLG